MDKACHFCSSFLRLYCSERQRFPLPSDTPLPCFCLENLNSILNTSGSCLNDSALRRERKIVLHFSCYLKTIGVHILNIFLQLSRSCLAAGILLLNVWVFRMVIFNQDINMSRRLLI